MSQNPDATPNPSESSVDPQSVEGLFVAALAKSSNEERIAFLDEVCRDDPERRRRVEALLRAYDDSEHFMEQPAGDWKHPPEEMSLDFLTPSEKPELLGTLGPYEIMDVIGRGGMGVVLRGLDPKLHRVVAVKVLAPELAANPNARRRFLREARAVASISHPHIVTIHAVDEEQTPYFVMECIGGQTLQEKLNKSGSLQLAEILRISKQIAEGLSAAHRQGLIHRDIKPSNILLENGVERVKITDFGLARAVDDLTITRTGEVSGTPEYMSPEQARGENVDQRSDLFNLGAVMYAMCTGRSPFRGTSLASVIRKVCDERPRSIREENLEIPDWLIQVVERLLEKNPDERFQSADEVAAVLEECLAHLQHPGRAVPQLSGPAHRRTQPIDAGVVRSERTVKSELERVSRMLIVTALLNCFLVLAGFGVLALFPILAPVQGQLGLLLSIVIAVLLLSFVISWSARNMVRLELGHEARINGAVAAALSMISGPAWIVSWPISLSAFSFMKRKEVREAYSSGGSESEAALCPTQALPRYAFLGRLGGGLLTTLFGLWLASQGTMRWSGANIAEALTVTLIAFVIFGVPISILALLWKRHHGSQDTSDQQPSTETQRPRRNRSHAVMAQPGKSLAWMLIGFLLLLPISIVAFLFLGIWSFSPLHQPEEAQVAPEPTGTVEISWDDDMPLYKVSQVTSGTVFKSDRVDSNPFVLNLPQGSHLLRLTFLIDGQFRSVQTGVVAKTGERVRIDGRKMLDRTGGGDEGYGGMQGAGGPISGGGFGSGLSPTQEERGTVIILHDGKTLKSIKLTGKRVAPAMGKERLMDKNPYIFTLPVADYGVDFIFLIDGEPKVVHRVVKLKPEERVTIDAASMAEELRRKENEPKTELLNGSSNRVLPRGQMDRTPTGTVEISFGDDMPLYKVTEVSSDNLVVPGGVQERVEVSPLVFTMKPGTHLLMLTFIINDQPHAVKKGVVVKSGGRVVIDGRKEAEALRPNLSPSQEENGTVVVVGDDTLVEMRLDGKVLPSPEEIEIDKNKATISYSVPPGEHSLTFVFAVDGGRKLIRKQLEMESRGNIKFDAIRMVKDLKRKESETIDMIPEDNDGLLNDS